MLGFSLPTYHAVYFFKVIQDRQNHESFCLLWVYAAGLGSSRAEDSESSEDSSGKMLRNPNSTKVSPQKHCTQLPL